MSQLWIKRKVRTKHCAMAANCIRCPSFYSTGVIVNEYLAATLLGLVEGITEFLPVSSSGHLIITSALLGLDGARVKTFEIIIQLGAIMAVVILYWPKFWGLLFPKENTYFSGVRGLWLLFLTSLPASFLGLLVHKSIKLYLFNPISVALALAAGAFFILWVEWRKPRATCASLDTLTPAMALGIGCFQCLSLWPGFSRSAATIMGGMVLGAQRSTAAEYSFIAAVPIMMAATAFDLYKSADTLSTADIPFFAIGLGVSFLTAIAAIKLFVGLVQRISMRPFAWYRLALAPVVFYFFNAA